MKGSPLVPQLEKTHMSQQRLRAAKRMKKQMEASSWEEEEWATGMGHMEEASGGTDKDSTSWPKYVCLIIISWVCVCIAGFSVFTFYFTIKYFKQLIPDEILACANMLMYLTCGRSLGCFFLSANWREHLLGHRCELKGGCWFSEASEWGDWAMCLVTYLCLLDLLSPPWSSLIPNTLLLYATDDEWFWCPWSSSQSLLRAKSKSKAALQMISNSLLLFQEPGGLKSWLSSVRLARDCRASLSTADTSSS